MSHWKSISTIALAILLTYGLAWLGENPELLSPRGALIENDAQFERVRAEAGLKPLALS